ncbi:hypothetical protein CVT26_013657 [Gymnopilus dilepis]|uniref:AAA+ ATPase domain-containing protein n=1 Tax=Gymnopilus dilepis TaxID=231916 RepID=A0A409YWG8_9AGAR|nr:hypothetical protein CVT26_013657 [Gymnopilus dilepis]
MRNKDGPSFTGQETDIVILVIGPVGAGKSTFINVASGDARLEVNAGVNPCTGKPYPVVMYPTRAHPKFSGHRLILVDTPGFDSPNDTDKEILATVDTWLGQTYPAKVVFGGLLYVHDITNKKFTRADRLILPKLSKRYGNPAMKTILATTNWGPPPPPEAETREEELANKHWKSITDDGAKVHRFLGTQDSAWSIINDLLVRVDPNQNEAGSRLMDKVHSFLEKLRKRKQRQCGDSQYTAKETDIVVLVIGPVGAGKSTFINSVVASSPDNCAPLAVSHGTNPCTTDPFPVVFDTVPEMPHLKGHRLILVDTPGFDSPSADDKKILSKIDKWLEKNCSDVIIGGVLYVYDITTKKVRPAERLVFGRILKKYGKSAFQKTILATTNWGPPEPANAVEHEAELKEEHWRAVTIDGAKVYRYLNTVVGVAGTGKSTLINAALGVELLATSDDLNPPVQRPRPVVVTPGPAFPHVGDHQVVLVDTPGLDNGQIDDDVIWNSILGILKNACQQTTNICLIYLHDIHTTSPAEQRLVEQIIRLNQNVNLGKVVIGITRSEELEAPRLKQRVSELTQTHWKPLIEAGAEVCYVKSNRDVSRFPMGFRVTSIGLTLPQLPHLDEMLGFIYRKYPVFCARETDIVIPAVGQLGSGKSTFINDPSPVVFDVIPNVPGLSGRRLVLLDSPGFDSPYQSDKDISNKIAQWVRKQGKATIAGLLYMYDIDNKKIGYQDPQRLRMVCDKLDGRPMISKTIIVTTNRGPSLPINVKETREQELREGHWRVLIGGGASVRRFLNTMESAWNIIDGLLRGV